MVGIKDFGLPICCLNCPMLEDDQSSKQTRAIKEKLEHLAKKTIVVIIVKIGFHRGRQGGIK